MDGEWDIPRISSPPTPPAHGSRMRVESVDPIRPDPSVIDRAAACLEAGGLVAFPTETVYGLGADATRRDAIAALFRAKGRPSTNPLITHVSDVGRARDLVGAWPVEAAALARRFWPGPLTLVLPRGTEIIDAVTAGLPTMAIRVPDHPVARALLRAFPRPIAAPSANPSTRISPTTADHVAGALAQIEGVLLDGGATPVGIESTVVSLVNEPTLLRPGSIAAGEIEAVIGPIRRRVGPVDPNRPAPAPGMTSRHYAPSARLHLFRTGEAFEVRSAVEAAAARGTVTGALLRSPLEAPFEQVVPMPADAAAYARQLYASLHALDTAGVQEAWVESVPESDEWEAVRDRLRRASTR